MVYELLLHVLLATLYMAPNGLGVVACLLATLYMAPNGLGVVACPFLKLKINLIKCS